MAFIKNPSQFNKGLPSEWLSKFPHFDYKQFTISKNKKLFDQEASTLGLKAGLVPHTIVINGKKHKVAFYLAKNYNKDSDYIEFFTYKPYKDYIDQNPELEGWTVIIWND